MEDQEESGILFVFFFPGSCSFLCRNKMCILKHSVVMIIQRQI